MWGDLGVALSWIVCPPKRIATAEAMNILLDPNLDRARVCSSQLVAVEQNHLFIVDLREKTERCVLR